MKKYIIRTIIGLFGFVVLLIIAGILYNFLVLEEYYKYPHVSFTDVAKDRTKLINGIESYQNITELISYFKNDTTNWTFIEDSNSDKNNSKPPFNIYIIEINNYSHLGYTGTLKLEFFNNRLMSTWYYPKEKEFDKYVETLEKNEKINIEYDTFSNHTIVNILPYTHIWLMTDDKGKKYIGWEDIRLGKENNLWIERYS
jgi:hypothetical protein